MRHLIFSLGAVTVLAGCGNPLNAFDRLADVVSSDASVAVAASATPPQRGGLFARLLNRPADDPTDAAIEAALADLGAVDVTPQDATDVEQGDAAPRGGGLFGLLRNNRTTEDGATDAVDEAEIVQAAAPAPLRGLAGLFGGGATGEDPPEEPRTGPDRTDVEIGTTLPFGQIARVCGVRRAQLGKRIADGGGFSIYDTNPDATTPRPFYITGFKDDCARTFTGAVAVPGDIRTHEFVRYQPSNERINYSATDNAYEALKASVCRVGRGQPCGSQARELSRNTYFVSVYSFFGDTLDAVPTEWSQILLHDGAVLATSIKSN